MKHDIREYLLFENEDFMVINKPSGIATLDERKDVFAPSILRMAKAYVEDAQVGHRLDKETTGALVIAKNPEAYRHISMQFEHRETAKRYHAVVEGMQDWEGMLVNLPILPLKDGKVVIDRQRGKDAETWFRTLQVFRGYTLVECMPITGRMHQIRIHLTCLKAPIVADGMYGGPEVYLSDLKRNYSLKKNTEELPLMRRVALHARSLSFKLLDDSPITVEAPYPKDFAVLVKQLGNFS
jgi:23S rRNA pseudouridine955/2504/2580 synthase